MSGLEVDVQLETPSVGPRSLLVSREGLWLVRLDRGDVHLSVGGGVGGCGGVGHRGRNDALQMCDAGLIPLDDGVDVLGSGIGHDLKSWGRTPLIPMQQPRFPLIEDGSRVLARLSGKSCFLSLEASGGS